MREIKRIAYTKEDSKWIESVTMTDEKEIYKALAIELFAKKIHKCKWIKSIREYSNYDGTRTVTVYYECNCKAVYTIKL